MKRLFDMIFSSLGIVILSPIFLWIAWRIHGEDGGPVFYRGERVGRCEWKSNMVPVVAIQNGPTRFIATLTG